MCCTVAARAGGGADLQSGGGSAGAVGAGGDWSGEILGYRCVVLWNQECLLSGEEDAGDDVVNESMVARLCYAAQNTGTRVSGESFQVKRLWQAKSLPYKIMAG